MLRTIARKLDKTVFRLLLASGLIKNRNRPAAITIVEVIERRGDFSFPAVDPLIRKELKLLESVSVDDHILYTIDSVCIAGPYGLHYKNREFYFDQLYSKEGHIQKSWPVLSLISTWVLKPVVYEQAISLVHLFSKGYFHFVFDTLLKLRGVLEKPEVVILVDYHLSPWQLEWLQLLGVESRIRKYNPAREFAKVKKLYNTDPPRGGLYRMETIQWLKSSVTRNLKSKLPESSTGLYYLQRKTTMFSASFLPSRIVDEELLIAFLKRKGFEVIFFDGKTVKEQMQIMSNAKVIVSAHGAGLTNMIFSENLSVFEIHRANHINPVYFYLAYLLTFRYDCAVFPVDENNNAVINFDLLENRLTGFLAKINL